MAVGGVGLRTPKVKGGWGLPNTSPLRPRRIPPTLSSVKVLLNRPRGFCAGVERAIEVVERALLKFGRPVYVRHEIVHNTIVVEELQRKGAVFVDRLEEVPAGSHLIFSAHGVPPEVVKQAQHLKLHAIDATCPLVTKVHGEARMFAKKDYIARSIDQRDVDAAVPKIVAWAETKTHRRG